IKQKGLVIIPQAIIIVISLIIQFFCSKGISLSSFKASNNVKKTLRTLIYEKLLRLGADYQENGSTAKIIQLAVEGVEQLEVWFGQYLPQFYYSMLATITVFLVLAFINVKMALVLLLCVPLIPLSMIVVQNIAKKLLGKYWSQYANLADNFLENLQGLTTLQIYKADDFKQKQMALEAEHFRKVTMKVLSMQLNSIIIMDIIAYGGAALGIACAISAYKLSSISIESCLACILLSADFFIPLRRLGSFFHTAMNGMSASSSIFELLDIPERKYGKLEILNGELTGYKMTNLSYNFDRPVLENCNIEIVAGTFTSFVGKSGSGKSTAAKILAGINVNYSGSVLINNVELNKVAPENIFKHCTYISFKDWIFKGTVKDCLLEGKSKATEEEMWNVLKSVKLADFLKEKNGLDTEIKENASNLSGGQKQRLSIARALIHDSDMYIFDEATSNIDIESEEAIMQVIKSLKGKKTILLITHRIENCLDSDKIYTFSNGKVKELK
ncbi:MAG: ABC transporter ATP-binding protein/permease, partial [Treponema sp.]|nr:ABC transporter ATP-binding protein/permease [Treponema sp.]